MGIKSFIKTIFDREYKTWECIIIYLRESKKSENCSLEEQCYRVKAYDIEEARYKAAKYFRADLRYGKIKKKKIIVKPA